MSYYAANNGVYLNGAGANGWLRLNAAGSANDRTSINLNGHSASGGDSIHFRTNSTERFRIHNNGSMTASGTIAPSANNTYDLGGSSNLWKKIYAFDLDVDGHTNLDNVSIAGVTTFTGNPTIYNADPQLTFRDSNHSPYYYYLKGRAGAFVIEDSVNGDRISFNASGSTSFSGSVVVVPSLQCSTNVQAEGNVNIGDSIVHIGDTDTKIRFPAADTVTVETAGAERLRIKSDGGILQKKTGGNANYTISRNESVGTTDQPIGVLDFASNTAHTVQARIMGKTLGTSNVGGDLVVETRADGGSLDERFRITGDGRVYIGASSGGNPDTDDFVLSGSGKKGITICSTNGSETRLVFADALSSTGAVIGQVLYDHSADRMDFYTGATRKASITSGGAVLLGATAASNAESFRIHTSDSGKAIIKLTNSTTPSRSEADAFNVTSSPSL